MVNDFDACPSHAEIGARAGQYSVRVNNQWRICFTWSSSGAAHVELVDYH